MHTLSDSETPSIHDLHTDANVQSSAVIDCIDAYFDADDFVAELDRAFSYAEPLRYDDDELAAMWAEEQAARNAPAAKWQPFELEAPATLNTIVRMPEAWGQRKAVSL
jgi:hypothetical protein